MPATNAPQHTREKASARDLQTFPFVMIPKAFFTRFRPSLKQLGAYVALKYHARNLSGTCEFIALHTMAKTAGMSESSFKRALRELVKLGAVRVRQRSKKSGRGERIPLPNLYELINLDVRMPDDQTSEI